MMEVSLPFLMNIFLPPFPFTGRKIQRLFRSPAWPLFMKPKFSPGNIPSFRNQEIHLACGLLKAYIRGLREPLITPDVIDAVLGVVGLPEEQQLPALKSELEKLPQTNRCVLYKLASVC
jgi:hypothetical protein